MPNLAQLLHLERSLVVFDLETTGVAEGSRIVEFAHRVHHPSGEVTQWRSLVNPEIPIPLEASAVNRITDEMVRNCRECGHANIPERHPGDLAGLGTANSGCGKFKSWPTFFQLANRISHAYVHVDFAGKNVRFDLGILAGEFARVKVAWSYAGARVLDAERLEAILEPRDLSSLYRRRLGKEPENAHSALADVEMTEEILLDQLKDETRLPRSLQKLHDLSWPGWIDGEGKMRRKNGVVVLSFGKYRDRPITQVDRSYWEKFVLTGNFSEEFKAIARECLAGRHPK